MESPALQTAEFYVKFYKAVDNDETYVIFYLHFSKAFCFDTQSESLKKG